MNVPDLVRKGDCELRALSMDSCLQGQVLSAAATSAKTFFGARVMWCCCRQAWVKRAPVLVGSNFCTCCGEKAENGSSARNVVFIRSHYVRGFTSPNPLCCVCFFGPS